MQFWTMWQSLWITEKRREKLGPAIGRPTPLVGRLRGSTPLFNPVQRELTALPLPEFHQFHFVFSAPLLSLLLFLSKFKRKRRKRLQSFAFSFASHLHFVFTFFPSQERVCGGTTTLQEWFVVRHRPQERFCGVLSPTRMIFVRGNHAPQGLLTLE